MGTLSSRYDEEGCQLTMSQIVLTINDIMITIQWATGYVTPEWSLQQHVLIDITSCLTLLGQSLSKTAFAVTLLKLTKGERWQQWLLWFIIVTMNAYNFVKVRGIERQPFEQQLMKFRLYSNGVKPVVLRKTFPWSDWTSVCTTISSTTSRKAETVGLHLQWHITSHRLTFRSIQHNYGFRPRCISVDDNLELEYQDFGEDWTLCGYVSGTVPCLSSLHSSQNLTLEIGHGRRN
jgi:hypothetical protein